jgi:hypothetical protein
VAWSKGWSYRGTYVATTAYPVNSVVVDSGSSYLARKSSTGKAPATNPTYWGLLAAAATAGATGPAGPAGPAGATGATGATGPSGPVNLRYLTGADVTIAPGDQEYGDVNCPAGTTLTGGGVYSSGLTDVSVNASYPVDTGVDADSLPNNRWAAYVNNNSLDDQLFRVYAICTTATTVS